LTGSALVRCLDAYSPFRIQPAVVLAATKLAIGDWIERVYNRRRSHSALSMIGPVEYENRSTQTAHAA
jgi:hypothetical protein